MNNRTIASILRTFADSIEAGNTNASEDELIEICDQLGFIMNPETKLSKYQAANLLGISYKTFDYYVSKGEIDLNTHGNLLLVRDFSKIYSSTDQTSLWQYLGTNFQLKLYDSGANQNMKTINSTSLLGSGNIDVLIPQTSSLQKVYRTGNTIEIFRIGNDTTKWTIGFGNLGSGNPYGQIGVKYTNEQTQRLARPFYIDYNSNEYDIALDSDLAFTYDSANTKYVSKGNIDLNGNNIDGVNFIDLDTTNTAFIYANDENVLSVNQYNDIVIGSDNAGTLTLRTPTNEVDFDTLISEISGKADTSDVLLKTDATTTATADKVVKRDGSGNIEGNYLKSTWLYTSGATDYASWSDVFVNNGGWLYKRAKASFKSDLGIPSGTLTTKENLTPQLLGYTQNSGYGNLQFDFDVDLTNKQGLGVLTYGNCQILVNLYGLTKGTTYYQNCLYRYTGSTGTTGLKNGMLAYSYYDAGSNITRATFTFYSLNSDGSIGSIQGSNVSYTAYLFLVNLK